MTGKSDPKLNLLNLLAPLCLCEQGDQHQKKSDQSVKQALTFVADGISSILSPSSSTVGGGSPAKVIDNCKMLQAAGRVKQS